MLKRKSLIGVVAAIVLILMIVAFKLRARAENSPGPDAGVVADANSAATELAQNLHSMSDLLDPAKRADMAPKIIPPMRRMRDDLIKLSKDEPDLAATAVQFNAMLALVGDQETQADLNKAAASSGSDALNAQCELVMADWWRTAHDAKAQAKVVDGFEQLAKANENEDICVVAAKLMLKLGAASTDQSQAIGHILTDDLKSPAAQQAAADWISEQKLAAMIGKPLTISGTTVDGKPFTTADWRGKPVLVDFWATWCVPCVAELPRVAKAYEDYHKQGLEIIGVSNDYQASDLTSFLGEHGEIAWPQIFDPAAAGQKSWNPVTEGLGINQIPTMILIDRKGICRSVDAAVDLDEEIEKLLSGSK